MTHDERGEKQKESLRREIAERGETVNKEVPVRLCGAGCGKMTPCGCIDRFHPYCQGPKACHVCKAKNNNPRPAGESEMRE